MKKIAYSSKEEEKWIKTLFRDIDRLLRTYNVSLEARSSMINIMRAYLK